MRISIGSDHGGLNLKNSIVEYLQENDYEVMDVGTYSFDSCDYPIFGRKVAENVANKVSDLGIVVCSTGIGMSIVANKVKGIRCALVTDLNSAKLTKEHNDSNVLALGEKNTTKELAIEIVKTWLNTPFSNDERHIRRIKGIIE